MGGLLYEEENGGNSDHRPLEIEVIKDGGRGIGDK